MNSIKTKLTVIIAIVSILILGAISYLNYNRASNILMGQIQSAASISADNNARLIDEWLIGVQKEIEVLSQTDVIKSLEPEQYIPIATSIAENQKDYDLIYVANLDGEGETTTGATVNIADRPYFKEAMQSGKSVISDPIVSRATGEQVIAVGTPIYQEGIIIGFVGATATLDHLQELIKDMKLSGKGYGLIQGADMATIAHPDEKWLGNKEIVTAGDERLTIIFKRMSQGESGYAEYALQGVEKIMAFAPIKTTDWSIAQTADMADVMAPLTNVRKINLTITVIGILVLLITSVIIAHYVAKPLVILSNAAGLVAKGDLTQEVKVKGKDEIGRLAASFNEMTDNLKNMVLALGEKSISLTSSAQQLSANAEETSAGATETSSTMTEVAATVEQAAQNIKAVKETADGTRDEAEQGRNGIINVTNQMENISDSTQNVAQAINNLNVISEKIGIIVETITNIADQTNLLALNAAIEAARAGEHGRGFAVVAEEVRKLAEQSASAAQEIKQLITSVQVESKQASDAMESGAGEVQKGVEVVHQVGLSFGEIIDKIKSLVQQVDEIASGSEQVSSAVQNVASTTEESTAAMEEIASSTENLTQMAAELQKMAAQFKVSDVVK